MSQQDHARWKKVIFVDWHGVLSHDPFWISILHNEQHPLHSSLLDATSKLFREQDDFVRDWMRGDLNVSQIVELLQIELELEFPRDYLTRKSVDDCQLMRINSHLIPLLQSAQETGTAIVLATDNMDCFHEAIQTARTLSPPVREPESTPFNTISRLFDDVLCSSEQRILKSEDPQRFFEHWLVSHALDFIDALLLDDLEINCNAFRTVGGTAIQITHESLEEYPNKVFSEVEYWLRTANAPA